MPAIHHLLRERVTLSPEATKPLEVWARVDPQGAAVETDDTGRARVVRRYRILLRREEAQVAHGGRIRWGRRELAVESHAIAEHDRRLLVLDCREEVA